ncbi:hypothetical protein D9M70_651390 [compost metagenome]
MQMPLLRHIKQTLFQREEMTLGINDRCRHQRRHQLGPLQVGVYGQYCFAQLIRLGSLSMVRHNKRPHLTTQLAPLTAIAHQNT